MRWTNCLEAHFQTSVFSVLPRFVGKSECVRLFSYYVGRAVAKSMDGSMHLKTFNPLTWWRNYTVKIQTFNKLNKLIWREALMLETYKIGSLYVPWPHSFQQLNGLKSERWRSERKKTLKIEYQIYYKNLFF